MNKPFQCGICKKVYKNFENLLTHVRVIHQNYMNVGSLVSGSYITFLSNASA